MTIKSGTIAILHVGSKTGNAVVPDCPQIVYCGHLCSYTFQDDRIPISKVHPACIKPQN
jgi:hypothetical protein